MSQPCAITACKRTSRALCYCCQQSICLQHLKEHNDLLVFQLNPLVDQINTIGDRLKAINIENKIGNFRQNLEQWRMDCHKKIDDFFEKKCQEISQRVSGKIQNQREEIDRIQSKIGALIREEEVSRQDIDLLTSTVRTIDQHVDNFEHINLSIKIQPLVIDDSLIDIEELNINRFDLAKMSPACKTINYTDGSCGSLASNDRFLLMHQQPDLCLIDQNFKIVRQTTWNHGDFRDIGWSSSLNRFIIIGEKDVFSINEKTMSIDKFVTLSKRNWFSCTCSDSSLFLSTYELASSIIEYNLLPTMEIIKEWKSPVTCQKEEWITDMKYNNGSITLMIKNSSENTLFIELRNIKTLDRLWSFKMDCMDLRNRAFYCCLLNDEELLVMDHGSDRLVHITKDGRMKSSCAYKSRPLCATLFGSDIIAISTNKGVNFHKF